MWLRAWKYGIDLGGSIWIYGSIIWSTLLVSSLYKQHDKYCVSSSVVIRNYNL